MKSRKKIAKTTFKKEIEFLSQLKHPQLPGVYGTFSQHGRDYLVMEYVDGETLEEIIEKKKGPLPEDDVLNWAIQLTDVLDYFHSQTEGPIVYRDLKPANIIITPVGTAKIVDLGIARRYQPGKVTDTLRFGTPGYAAPEQFKGMGQSNPRTDIYGLGVIMYQLLTNHDPTVTPFKFPPLRSLNSKISEELEKIINRAIEKNPAGRYENMSAFKNTLLFYSREHYGKEDNFSGKEAVPSKYAREKTLPKSRRFTPSEPLPRASKGKVTLFVFCTTFLMVGGASLFSVIGTFGSIGAYPGALGLICWIGFIPAMLLSLMVYLGDFRYY